jgi:hypothetical protein
VQQIILEDLMVFAGLMATLGSVTRIILTVLRRKSTPVPDGLSEQLRDISARLERMEQTLDSTALEVERVGEGQRFAAHLLAGRSQTAPVPTPVPARGAESASGRVVTPH